MVEVVDELKVELTEINGKHYFRLLFDGNMNIYIHPRLVKKNEKGQDVVNFDNTKVNLEQTRYKNYFLMQPGNRYIVVLASDKMLEIRLDYEDPIGGYYYEFRSKGIYYYFIDGGYNGFTFRYNGILYIVTTDNKIKEVKEYEPPKEFEVNLNTLSYLW